ncbi:MAG: response regulator transcription factor [Marinilabiliaceae bacterium]|jgi:DNA-binding NarL/FixJ family response regulator|nr:response regulator transcription factor [Marinilabiliaceae bacterium]
MKEIKAFLLDDDPDALLRLEYLLGKHPEVRITGSETDPQQAVHQIKSKRPDLLFLDVEMPVKGGFEILDSIRQENFCPAIVLVTGYNNYAIKAIKESVLDYLLKPVDPDELSLTIKKYIANYQLNTDSIICQAADLTEREAEIFDRLREGKTSREIAQALSISKNTVDTHRRRILKKLGLRSTTEIHLKYPLLK